MTTAKVDIFEAENGALRELPVKSGLDALRCWPRRELINATEKEAAERLQRLLLEELHIIG